jgi:beta-alanine--pyruvate transaminase
VRGYDAIERMYADHDLYVRVAADTIVPSPPLIVSESQIGEIRDKIAAVIKAVA